MFELIGTSVVGWLWDKTFGRLRLKREWKQFTAGGAITFVAWAKRDGHLVRQVHGWIVTQEAGTITVVGYRNGVGPRIQLLTSPVAEFTWRDARRDEGFPQFRRYRRAVEVALRDGHSLQIACDPERERFVSAAMAGAQDASESGGS
jgi:hypothetical protein